MGTPVAYMWSIIYYWWHEKHCLLPKYGSKIKLLKRFIDDMASVILIGGEDGMSALEWIEFKKDVNTFGILTWEIHEPSHTIDFLDLTVEIKDGSIVTRTYQKPMNLYQYIPPHSSHPPGMIKGMVYGLLQQYFLQNSIRDDYWKMVRLFYRRLKRQGWSRATLEPIFIEAHESLMIKTQTMKVSEKEKLNYKKLVILHLEYHEKDMPRKLVRKLFEEHCGDILSKDLDDGGLEIERAIVAYSRPPNMRDLLQSAKLLEEDGKEVSTYFGG